MSELDAFIAFSKQDSKLCFKIVFAGLSNSSNKDSIKEFVEN